MLRGTKPRHYQLTTPGIPQLVGLPAPVMGPTPGEGNPGESARLYEKQLRTFFAGASWPRFDLVLLGMGEDGHTASLFPGSDALNEKSKWVVATRPEGSGQNRITLTVPVFNQAARVIFLVTGAGKAERLAQVLRPQPIVSVR